MDLIESPVCPGGWGQDVCVVPEVVLLDYGVVGLEDFFSEVVLLLGWVGLSELDHVVVEGVCLSQRQNA